jgi:hypothetical protein
LVKFAPVKAIIDRKLYRVEPEFGFIVTGFDMDVGWLLHLITEKEKAETPYAENGRHRRTHLTIVCPKCCENRLFSKESHPYTELFGQAF